MAGRGWPGDEPVQAGGRLGEWLAGTFAAAVAAAAARHAARGGRGEIIDVSTYEAMVIAMGVCPPCRPACWVWIPYAQRSLELPSIVPTADGMVGFCTITAQQFQDFLVMIDRADLVDDAELASMPGRIARRDEFLGMVTQWTATAPQKRSSILRWRSGFRWPPSQPPRRCRRSTTSSNAGYSSSPSSARLRRGCRIAATRSRPGRPDGPRCWAPTTAGSTGHHDRTGGTADRRRLPLSDIRVTDLTAFWAGPVATQLLGALGADVIKSKGVRRPDGMRFAVAAHRRRPVVGVGPGLPVQQHQQARHQPRTQHPGGTGHSAGTHRRKRSRHRELLAEGDGELRARLGRGAPRTRARMIRMPAFGLDGPWRDRVGFAQTMEQATGMAWMTGPADGPPVIPRGACDPIAGLHAAFAAIAALEIRDRTGRYSRRIDDGGGRR